MKQGVISHVTSWPQKVSESEGVGQTRKSSQQIAGHPGVWSMGRQPGVAVGACDWSRRPSAFGPVPPLVVVPLPTKQVPGNEASQVAGL